MIIGLEGPAGAGKTTMARTVASEFGAVVVEGGAWYRALAYEARRRDIPVYDVDNLIGLAEQLTLRLESPNRIMLEGNDVTDALYSPDIAVAVPQIARHLPVREKIEPKIVAEARAHDLTINVGRHLRTVLPEAYILAVKIDPDEAIRRSQHSAAHDVQSLKQRRDMDEQTKQLLGETDDGKVVVDVTDMSPAQQADTLRQFIKQCQNHMS